MLQFGETAEREWIRKLLHPLHPVLRNRKPLRSRLQSKLQAQRPRAGP